MASASSGGRDGSGAGPRNNSRGSKRRRNEDPLTKIGRQLTAILRHKAQDHGLVLRSDGYVAVDDLRQRVQAFRGMPIETIQQVVAADNKGRFGLREEERGVWFIRANQGHSIATIDEAALFKELLDPGEVPVCIHGTNRKAWATIRQRGLSRMGRTHIHCAKGLLGEDGVKSGMRASCNVLIYVDVPQAMADGVRFFESDNGVVLTAGVGESGTLPSRYFERVVECREGKIGEVSFRGSKSAWTPQGAEAAAVAPAAAASAAAPAAAAAAASAADTKADGFDGLAGPDV